MTYTLNLWGPMLRMSNAASQQAVEVFKERLREFLETNETGRQAISMTGRDPDSISLRTLDSRGKEKAHESEEEDDI